MSGFKPETDVTLPKSTSKKTPHFLKTPVVPVANSRIQDLFKSRTEAKREECLADLAKQYAKIVKDSRPGENAVALIALLTQMYDSLDKQNVIVQKCPALLTKMKSDTTNAIFQPSTIETVQTWSTQTTAMTKVEFELYDTLVKQTGGVYMELITRYNDMTSIVQERYKGKIQTPTQYETCLNELTQISKLSAFIQASNVFEEEFAACASLAEFISLDKKVKDKIKKDEIDAARKNVQETYPVLPAPLLKQLADAKTIDAINTLESDLFYRNNILEDISKKRLDLSNEHKPEPGGMDYELTGGYPVFDLPPFHNDKAMIKEAQDQIDFLDNCLVLRDLISEYNRKIQECIIVQNADVNMYIATGKKGMDVLKAIKSIRTYISTKEADYIKYAYDRNQLTPRIKNAITLLDNTGNATKFLPDSLRINVLDTYLVAQRELLENFPLANITFRDNLVLLTLIQTASNIVETTGRSDYLREKLFAVYDIPDLIAELKDFLVTARATTSMEWDAGLDSVNNFLQQTEDGAAETKGLVEEAQRKAQEQIKKVTDKAAQLQAQLDVQRTTLTADHEHMEAVLRLYKEAKDHLRIYAQANDELDEALDTKHDLDLVAQEKLQQARNSWKDKHSSVQDLLDQEVPTRDEGEHGAMAVDEPTAQASNPVKRPINASIDEEDSGGGDANPSVHEYPLEAYSDDTPRNSSQSKRINRGADGEKEVDDTLYKRAMDMDSSHEEVQAIIKDIEPLIDDKRKAIIYLQYLINKGWAEQYRDTNKEERIRMIKYGKDEVDTAYRLHAPVEHVLDE